MDEVSWRRIMFFLIRIMYMMLATSAVIVFVTVHSVPEIKTQTQVSGYHCPMHPHVTADKPGTCPVCGMELVPKGTPEPPVVLPEAVFECDDDGKCPPTAASCEAIVESALDSKDALLRALAVPVMQDTTRMKEFLGDLESIVREATAIEVGRRRITGLLSALQRASKRSVGDLQGAARVAALDARIRLGDKKALKDFRKWLRSNNTTTRALAIGYASDHKEFLSDLRRMADEDQSASVRGLAQHGLAHLGEPGALERIRDQWDYRTYRIHSKADPTGSRKRLGKIIKKALKESSTFRDDMSLDLWFLDTSAAAAALLSLGEPLGRVALHELLDRSRGKYSEHGKGLRAEMHSLVLLQRLREFAAPEDLGAVAPCLKISDPAIRVAAAVNCVLIHRKRLEKHDNRKKKK
jgi:hypothetical protein